MLYGSETWFMTSHPGRVLGGFHHRVARRLAGRKNMIGRDGVWVYPPLEGAMAESVLQEVETYVYRRQNTATQFIATRPIMDLCLVSEQRLGSSVAKRWWDQEGLDMVGMNGRRGRRIRTGRRRRRRRRQIKSSGG